MLSRNSSINSLLQARFLISPDEHFKATGGSTVASWANEHQRYMKLIWNTKNKKVASLVKYWNARIFPDNVRAVVAPPGDSAEDPDELRLQQQFADASKVEDSSPEDDDHAFSDGSQQDISWVKGKQVKERTQQAVTKPNSQHTARKAVSDPDKIYDIDSGESIQDSSEAGSGERSGSRSADGSGGEEQKWEEAEEEEEEGEGEGRPRPKKKLGQQHEKVSHQSPLYMQC